VYPLGLQIHRVVLSLRAQSMPHRYTCFVL